MNRNLQNPATSLLPEKATSECKPVTYSEITFKDFANIAKRRGHTPESLAALFRGKIEEPREFFERVTCCRYHGQDRSAVVIPYRSVIEFYQQEAHYSPTLQSSTENVLAGAGGRYSIARNGL